MQEWLENDASVSTLDISLETSYSKLMIPEYKRLSTYEDMHALGYKHVVRPFYNYPVLLNQAGMGENQVRLHVLSGGVDRNFSRNDRNAFLFENFRREVESYDYESNESMVSMNKDWWMDNIFRGTTWQSDGIRSTIS